MERGHKRNQEKQDGIDFHINFVEVFGLAILIAFTFIIIFISVLSRGALIYYYEPNKIIWIVEVMLGICGIITGIKMIYGKLT